MAFRVCVLCQPVHSLIHPYVHQLDFFSEIFLWRLVYAVVCVKIELDILQDDCEVTSLTSLTEILQLARSFYPCIMLEKSLFPGLVDYPPP